MDRDTILEHLSHLVATGELVVVTNEYDEDTNEVVSQSHLDIVKISVDTKGCIKLITEVEL